MQLTGRWPLLLDLAAHSIERRVAMGHSTPEAVDAVVQRLRSAGPAGLDPLDREARRVSASVAASVDTLPTEAQPRFAELAIFPEDIDIPLTAISALWRSTARLDAFESEQVCGALLDALHWYVPPEDRFQQSDYTMFCARISATLRPRRS